MSKLTPEVKSTTPKVVEIPRTCYANLHMTLEEFALWTVCLAMSYHSGVLYFDGRELAKRFEGVAKNRIYRTRDGLVKKGWFVLLRERRRAETGIWKSAQYRVLTVEEWGKEHPHTCENISPGSITGQASSPTSGTGSQGLLRNYPGSITQLSSPTSGTYLTEENLTEEKRERKKPALSSIPKPSGQETKTLKLADQVAVLAFAENSGVSFNGKSRLAIEQGLSEYGATDKELSLTVPEIVRQMDDFQLRNAGGILAASLPGRIVALRNAASKEREDEIDLEEANRIVDENIAKKKAKEDAEAEKRRAEEEYERLHQDEI